MQRPEVGHQGRHLGRVQVVTVRRHLATALEHLTDQLILGQLHRDVVETLQHRAQTHFAFPHRIFRPFAIADVPPVDHDAADGWMLN